MSFGKLTKTRMKVPVRPAPPAVPAGPARVRQTAAQRRATDDHSRTNTAMTLYLLSDVAYTKIIIHSLKHPHARVNGVLLGTDEGNDQVTVVDAIPLLHHWTNLSPMMEIGLDMAKTYAAARDKLSVVGYYEASEYIDEGMAALGKVGERVALKVREGFSNALAIVVDSAKLGRPGNSALIASSESTFSVAKPASLHVSDAIVVRALDLARDNALVNGFGDFDDHLEDVTIDWIKNGAIVEAVERR